jgi:hypothetical protein
MEGEGGWAPGRHGPGRHPGTCVGATPAAAFARVAAAGTRADAAHAAAFARASMEARPLPLIVQPWTSSTAPSLLSTDPLSRSKAP